MFTVVQYSTPSLRTWYWGERMLVVYFVNQEQEQAFSSDSAGESVGESVLLALSVSV